jgi:hypothetical protein
MKDSMTLVPHSAARPLVGRRLADRLGVRAPPGALRTAVAFLAALLALFLVWSGWLYPLRPDVIGGLGRPFAPLFPGAWGGPTLVGAWVVHALVALVIQVGCVVVIRSVRRR